MSGFEIRIGRPPTSALPSTSLLPGWLDVLIDGMNVTARVGESQVLPFLRDVAHAVVDLSTRRKARATLPFYLYDDAWELGLVRDGEHALLSVYRGGPSAEVAVHERRLASRELRDGVARALDDALSSLDQRAHADARYARELLSSCPAWAADHALPQPAAVPFSTPGDGPLRFAGELSLRHFSHAAPQVARADLLSLLVRGRVCLLASGHERDMGEVFVFLLAEKLLEIAAAVLDADEQSAPYHVRFDVVGLRCSVRICDDGAIAFSLRRDGARVGAVGEVFPARDAREFASAMCDLARSVTRAMLRADRTLSQNLRFLAARSALRRVQSRARPRPRPASQVNDAPESYRAFALALRREPREAPPRAGKLRFAQKWEATIPGIELSSTFLCGDRLVVTGSRELAAIDRSNGEVLWKRTVGRALAVPTPGGLARLTPDGQLQVHDFGTGEVSLTVRLLPRLGGHNAGTVIHAPGLPKLLVLGEGERHLSAVDLVTGEMRWRSSLLGGGPCKLRRAGKLLLTVDGSPNLSAIDVTSGEVVWRHAGEEPFTVAPSFDHDTVFAVTGDATPRRGRRRLLAVDAWTGSIAFEVPLPGRPGLLTAPLLTERSVAVVLEDERGLGLAVFDRSTGALRFCHEPGLAPLQSSFLAVDDAIFANTERGELLCIDVESGAIRYRLALADPSRDALPRRLEPVLRSGALFVPQREVHVVRPSDGELLGKVPTDLVPDLLRVDERCDVYVAEESGHLAALGSGPRLALVKA